MPQSRSVDGVCTVVYVIFGVGCGGAETVLLELIKGLDRERFRPIVVSLAPPGDLSGEFERAGVPVHYLGLRKLVGAPIVLVKVWSLVRRIRPDILHGVMFYGDITARTLRLLGVDVPVISAVHSTRIGPRSYDYVMRWTDRLADAVTAVSDEVARGRLVSRTATAEKLVVIPNGIDFRRVDRPAEEELEALRARFGIATGERVLMCAGRLVPVKNHELLLRVFARLRANHSSLRLLLVGAGPLRDHLAQLAAELGIGSSVTFAGQVAPIGPVFHLAEVFVLSSSVEGLPMVLLEAMGAGLPTVATRVGGIPEVIEEGRTGLLVPPNDAAALEEAIRAVLDLSEEERSRMGESGKTAVRQEFGSARMVESTQALYHRVLAARDWRGAKAAMQA